MKKKYKSYEPNQIFLMPPSLSEWLPENHLAYFISDVVDELDISEIRDSYEEQKRGQPPYHPTMMTKLLFYAYCIGVPSSRKIETKTYEDVAFRMLSADAHPDHDTIAEFRARHLNALAGLFMQVLHLCRKAGLVKLGHVALDGTKVKANASKHKAMSYGRMGKKEKELEEQVKELLEKAREVDEQEDRKYGKGKRGDELPEELSFRKGRLKKIREAKKELEREAEEKALAEGKIDKEGKRIKVRDGRRPKNPPGKPRSKDQRNFTDPESRIMKDTATKGFVQGYNSQAAVDAEAQVIVAADVTNQPNDKQQIGPMVEQIEENLGERPEELSADCGYYSEKNVKALEEKNIDPYVATGRKKHNDDEEPVKRGRIPESMTTKQRMQRKLNTKRGKRKYGLRKEVAEPVFGQIKQARGFRQFSLRGLDKVRAEWRMICMTHNILKLFRSGCMVFESK